MNKPNPHSKKLIILRCALIEFIVTLVAFLLAPTGGMSNIVETGFGLWLTFNAIVLVGSIFFLLTVAYEDAQRAFNDYERQHNEHD